MKKNKSKIRKIRKYIISLLIIVLSVVAITPFNVFAEDVIPVKSISSVSEHCYDDNSHSMDIGDIGQWFNSRTELENYVTNIIQQWRDKINNGEITMEEYNKNAPTGYEAWSCAYCGKWTGDFKYREFCYDDNSHSKDIGDIGQWFNTLDDLDVYVEGVVNDWADRYNRGEITKEEYEKNAPNGYTAWSCAYCGKWTGDFKYYPAHDEVDECQHEWAYMQYGSSHYKYCVKCGEGSYEPCTYTTEVVSPTCTEQGYTNYTCIYCGATMTGDFVPATGHSYSYVSNNDGTHYQVCTKCGDKTANENCVRTVEGGKVVCKDCGYVFETVTEPTTDPTTEPTTSEEDTTKPTEPSTEEPTEPSTDEPDEPSSETPTDPTTEPPSEEESSTDTTVKPTEPSTEPSTDEETSDTSTSEKPSEITTQPSEMTTDSKPSEDVTEPTATTAVSDENNTVQNDKDSNNNESDVSVNTANPDIPDTGDNNTTQKLIVLGVVLVAFIVIFILVSKKMKKK